jgi:hypothetical protein
MVIATMTAFERRSLVEGIVGAAFRLPIRVVPGETLNLGLPNRMMVTLCVSLPLEGIILGKVDGWWKQEVEWCSSTASKTPSLGGVVQRGLGYGCVKMNSHRAGAPSGIMVASRASLVTRVNSTNVLDEGLRIGGRATTRDSGIEIGTRRTQVHVPAVMDRYILLAI